MSYLLDSLRALAFTMKSTFRKPVTVHYPAEKRQRAERYRNSFALLHDSEGDEACVGCLQCEKICPSQVITIAAEKKESPVSGKRRGYAKDFTLDLNACIFCELCVQVCPTDAIVMTRLPETPGYAREDLVLTMDKLYANETNRPLAWGRASNLMEMQDPKRGQAEPPPKTGSPAKETASTKQAEVETKTKKAEKADPAAKADAAGEKQAAAEAKDSDAAAAKTEPKPES